MMNVFILQWITWIFIFFLKLFLFFHLHDKNSKECFNFQLRYLFQWESESSWGIGRSIFTVVSKALGKTKKKLSKTKI